MTAAKTLAVEGKVRTTFSARQGALELLHDTRDRLYTYKGEATTPPQVTGDFCPACAESILDLAESGHVMRLMSDFHR